MERRTCIILQAKRVAEVRDESVGAAKLVDQDVPDMHPESIDMCANQAESVLGRCHSAQSADSKGLLGTHVS